MPVLAEDSLTEGFALNEGNGLVAANQAFGCVGEPADAAQGVKETERHSPCLLASLAWYTLSAQPRR